MVVDSLHTACGVRVRWGDCSCIFPQRKLWIRVVMMSSAHRLPPRQCSHQSEHRWNRDGKTFISQHRSAETPTSLPPRQCLHQSGHRWNRDGKTFISQHRSAETPTSLPPRQCLHQSGHRWNRDGKTFHPPFPSPLPSFAPTVRRIHIHRVKHFAKLGCKTDFPSPIHSPFISYHTCTPENTTQNGNPSSTRRGTERGQGDPYTYPRRDSNRGRDTRERRRRNPLPLPYVDSAERLRSRVCGAGCGGGPLPDGRHAASALSELSASSGVAFGWCVGCDLWACGVEFALDAEGARFDHNLCDRDVGVGKDYTDPSTCCGRKQIPHHWRRCLHGKASLSSPWHLRVQPRRHPNATPHCLCAALHIRCVGLRRRDNLR